MSANGNMQDDGIFDPRSPSCDIVRTPIAHTVKPKSNAELAKVIDPRSPTLGVDRTPLNLKQVKSRMEMSSTPSCLSSDKSTSTEKVLHLIDPRSPATDFNRTPLNLKFIKLATDPKQMTATEENNSDNLVRVNDSTSQMEKLMLAFDPRSPTNDFERTPLRMTALPLTDRKNNKVLEADLKSLDKLADPRSPSLEFSRTPLNIRMDEEVVVHPSQVTATSNKVTVVDAAPLDGSYSAPLKKLLPNFDPRSPTTEFDRTPLTVFSAENDKAGDVISTLDVVTSESIVTDDEEKETLDETSQVVSLSKVVKKLTMSNSTISDSFGSEVTAEQNQKPSNSFSADSNKSESDKTTNKMEASSKSFIFDDEEADEVSTQRSSASVCNRQIGSLKLHQNSPQQPRSPLSLIASVNSPKLKKSHQVRQRKGLIQQQQKNFTPKVNSPLATRVRHVNKEN